MLVWVRLAWTTIDVVINTSSIVRAPRARELLQRENADPIKYIILTHGHGDRTGGVPFGLTYEDGVSRFFSPTSSSSPAPTPTR